MLSPICLSISIIRPIRVFFYTPTNFYHVIASVAPDPCVGGGASRRIVYKKDPEERAPMGFLRVANLYDPLVFSCPCASAVEHGDDPHGGVEAQAGQVAFVHGGDFLTDFLRIDVVLVDGNIVGNALRSLIHRRDVVVRILRLCGGDHVDQGSGRRHINGRREIGRRVVRSQPEDNRLMVRNDGRSLIGGLVRDLNRSGLRDGQPDHQHRQTTQRNAQKQFSHRFFSFSKNFCPTLAD